MVVAGAELYPGVFCASKKTIELCLRDVMSGGRSVWGHFAG